MKNILAAIMLMGATVSVDAMMLPAATNKANTPTKIKKISDILTSSFFSTPANPEEQQAWQEILEEAADHCAEIPGLDTTYAVSGPTHGECNNNTEPQQANNIEHSRREEIIQLYQELTKNINTITATSVEKQNLRDTHAFAILILNSSKKTVLHPQISDTDSSELHYSDYSEAYYSDYSSDEETK